MRSRSAETTRNATPPPRSISPSIVARGAVSLEYRARLARTSRFRRRRQSVEDREVSGQPDCDRPDSVRGAAGRARQDRSAPSSAVTISAPAIGPCAARPGVRTLPASMPCDQDLLVHRHVHRPWQPPQASRRRRQRLLAERRRSSTHAARAAGHRVDAMAELRAASESPCARRAAKPETAPRPGVCSLAFRSGPGALLHLRLASEPSPDAEDIENGEDDVRPDERRLVRQPAQTRSSTELRR